MTTPSPGRSRWGRMGNVVRRASSAFSVRPGTPSLASDNEADGASVKGLKTTLFPDTASVKSIKTNLAPPPAAENVHAPSPIAESPEATVSQDDATAAKGPSPLSNPVVTTTPAESEAADASSAAPAAEAAPKETSPLSPQGYVPPPLIDSSAAGPGAFTDDTDELPTTQVIIDPSIHRAESSDDQHAANEPVPAPDLAPAPAERRSPTPEPHTPPPGLAGAGAGPSYFDIPIHDEPVEDLSITPDRHVAQPFEDVAERNVALPAPETAERPAAQERETLQPAVVVDRPVPAVVVPVRGTTEPLIPTEPATPEDDNSRGHTPPSPSPPPKIPAPQPQILPVSPPSAQAPLFAVPMPAFDYSTSGQEVWGGAEPAIREPVPEHEHAPATIPDTSTTDENADMSKRSSVHFATDIFADPVAPRIVTTRDEVPPHLPNPHDEHTPTTVSNDDGKGIVMPLPPLHSVVPGRSAFGGGSTDSLYGSRTNLETDERQPLLPSTSDIPKPKSYLGPSHANGGAAHLNVSPQPGVPTPSTWPIQHVGNPRLHELGWIEYLLPDGMVYYVHPTKHVTCDVDLRNEPRLDAVTTYLDTHLGDHTARSAQFEVWVREAEPRRRGFVFTKYLVDHVRRSVVLDATGDVVKKKKKGPADDQLDIEYRFWSFLEAHPAHVALPASAKTEAMDVLTWSWTDRLLPSHRTIPGPFSQEECQELMSLLRSFGDQPDAGLQSIVHTRMVARILLRLAHWRQQHFRSNKPLPKDVGSPDMSFPRTRRPFRRALFDFVISCLCLGIPYLFFGRHHQHRIDEESGLRNAAPMFLVGACTCLIAAVVLSASVTFLSLPGLDNFSRIAGLVAILFSSFSMVSTVVAIFRYKADLARPASAMTGEGLLMLSRRSVIMSLPLVFLLYSILAFVVGIVIFSFRGVTVKQPFGTEHPFDDYTRWTVVGVLGGLAGMLTMSLFLLRR